MNGNLYVRTDDASEANGDKLVEITACFLFCYFIAVYF